MDRRWIGIAVAGFVAGGCAALFVFLPGEPAQPRRGVDAHLTVLDDPRTEALPEAPGGAPNVVLVIGCTVRRDQLTPYGGHPEATPYLDAIARQGARVVDPIAAAPWTRAASAAIVTGHHALELGMVEPRPDRNERRLPDEAVSVAERFRQHGYTTIGATTNPNLNGVFGFEQGFDRYLQLKHLWRDSMVKLRGLDVLPSLFREIDTRPDPNRPLFLQVMLVDAHAPFTSTEEELARVHDDGLPDEVVAYRAALRELDDVLEALDAGLSARGLRDDTHFVFVSDHGEGLLHPEHHGRSHGRYLYPSAVHAAWIARGPGIAPGTEITGMASQVDVAPTLLGMAGLQAPAVTGRDLSESFRTGSPTGQDRVYADTWFMTANRAASYGPTTACMRSFADEPPPPAPTGEFVAGCYDRAADPDFRSPAAEPDRDRMIELITWRSDTSRNAIAGERVEVDEGLDAQLEALGYVQRENEP